MTKEIWKTITWLSNGWRIFQGSNFGRIRVAPTGLLPGTIGKPKIVQPDGSHKGYLYIDLIIDRKQITVYYHRTICQLFHGLPPPGDIVADHGDGNKKNNREDNLEWCTRVENTKRAAKMRLIASGENHSQAKLSKKQVIVIKKMLGCKLFTQKEIACIAGVSQPTISYIDNGGWEKEQLKKGDL